MAIYVVTGKLGGGKSLISVSRIREHIQKGLPVATNLDLNLVELLGPFNRDALVYRIPDKPAAADLELLGVVDTKADESKNGLLVLDECGTWFNSRSWNDPGRKEIHEWLTHARKFGWDVIFIVQDISILDKQAREAFAEHVVYCRRLDRLSVPFVGWLVSLLTGKRFRGPRVHVATVRYGDAHDSLVVDRWFYRGTDLYRAYDTRQVFRRSYSHNVFCQLPPYLSRGRYLAMSRFRYALTSTRRWFIRHPFVLLILGAAFAAPAYAMVFAHRSSALPASVALSSTISHPSATSASPQAKPYIIVGGAYVGTDSAMVFETPEGLQVTTEDLRRSGARVTMFDACRAVVQAPGQRPYVVMCGFPRTAPGPHDRVDQGQITKPVVTSSSKP